MSIDDPLGIRAARNALEIHDKVRRAIGAPRLFDDTTPSPKDDPMTDLTKTTETLDTMNGRKNKAIDTSRDVLPAPKSEASEVLATVTTGKDDDEKGAPINVMATASKVVRMIERHSDPHERARVMVAVGAGLGLVIRLPPTTDNS